MIVSLKTILGMAEATNTAVAAFNVTTLSGIRAVIAAAEELNQPVILQFANAAHKGYIPCTCKMTIRIHAYEIAESDTGTDEWCKAPAKGAFPQFDHIGTSFVERLASTDDRA